MTEAIHVERTDGSGADMTEPRSTGEARRAIVETRGRISETLDDIEDALSAKKERFKERVNVLRPVTDRVRGSPWPAVGIAFAAGVLLSRLGGDDEDEEEDRGGARQRSELDGEALRDWRQERRDRLNRMRAQRQESREPEEDEGGGLRDAVVGVVARVIGDGFRRYG
jgi:ElaB/YqjD/DUF883 family membrane-anchored ribosome-binding protein